MTHQPLFVMAGIVPAIRSQHLPLLTAGTSQDATDVPSECVNHCVGWDYSAKPAPLGDRAHDGRRRGLPAHHWPHGRHTVAKAEHARSEGIVVLGLDGGAGI